MALINCAECGTQISDKAAACIKCGAPVPEQIAAMAAAAATGICPNCKTVNPIDADKCLDCGMLFSGSSSWKLITPHISNPLPTYEGSYSAPSPRGYESRPQVVKSAKSRGIYIILGLFFGLLGIHNFYAGRLGIGLAQLLTTCILGWFVIGLFISGIWAIVELFMVTTDGAGDAFT